MRIEIHAETPEESKAFEKPFVYENVHRFAIAGRKASDSGEDIAYLHGPWVKLKGDIARMTVEIDTMANEQNMVNAVLQARNVVAHQAQVDRLTADVLAKRNGSGRIIH